MAEDNGDKVSIGAKVRPKYKTKIRTLAASQDKSMSQFVKEAAIEKFNRELATSDLALEPISEKDQGNQNTIQAD